MIIDGRHVQQSVDCDIAIVGAGPAGITLALELESTGHSVVILESGGRDFDAEIHQLTTGDSTGYPYHRLDAARQRGFAGTTRRWPPTMGWRARPLDPIDFEPRARNCQGSWPFSRQELWPYYQRAMSIGGILEPERRVPQWEQHGVTPPGLEGSKERFRTLAYQWAPADAFTRYWYSILTSKDISLYLYATATELHCSGRKDTVSSITVASPGSSGFAVRARRYVLALGGIENARMLLSSRSEHQHGIGNDFDLVGRFFMEHPIWDAAVIRPRDTDWAQAAHAFSNRETDGVLVDRWLSLAPDVMRREELLSCAFRLMSEPEARLSRGAFSARELVWTRLRSPRKAPETAGHVPQFLGSPGDLARNAMWRLQGRPARRLAIKVETQGEQEPNPDSRVVLSRRTDMFGVPVAELRWQLTNRDLDSMRRSVEILGEAVAQAGLGEFDSRVAPSRPQSTPWGGNHQMGTTRMSVDPREGVVDPNCRVHTMENLYIAGSSVFPTGGSSTPTLTITALAARLADHLATPL